MGVILHLFRKATGRVGIKNLAIEIHDSIKNLYFIGEIVNHQKKKYRNGVATILCPS